MKKTSLRFFALVMSMMLLFSSCQDDEAVPKKTDETALSEETERTTEENSENADTEKTFLITTKDELNAVRDNLNGNYRLENDIIFEQADFEKGGAFYNEGKGWAAIGDENFPFTGHFDGNGFTIQNLYININEKGDKDISVYASLFGRNDGMIENLLVLDCDINVEYDSGSARCGIYAAAVAGNSIGSIKNCSVSGNITAKVKSSNEKVFGFAGGICGSGNEVADCRNEADINAYQTLTVDKQTALASEANNTPYTGFCYAGGITGNANGDIERCINAGKIKAKADAQNPFGLVYDSVYAGGIAGNMNDANIRDCRNQGSIDAETLGTFCRAGGITGSAAADEITGCSNTAKISARTTSSRYDKGVTVGGIFGSGEAMVKDCFNSGNLYASVAPDPENTSDYAGLCYAGGICGGIPYELSNCYNIGKISVETPCDHSGVGSICAQVIPEDSVGLYYLDNTSVDADPDGYAVRCSDAEMKEKETYEWFDFDTVWVIDKESDYPYPTLR